MILNESQQMIRDTLRDFAREQLAPKAAEWDRNATFPRQALGELAALGVWGMAVPEEWGGAGLDYLTLAVALEEIAAGDGATSTILSVQNSLICGILMKYGTAACESWTDRHPEEFGRRPMKRSFAAFVLALGMATPIAASPIHRIDVATGESPSATNFGMPGFFHDFSSGWGAYRCPPACVMSNAPLYDPLPADLTPYPAMLGSPLIPTGSRDASAQDAPADPPQPIPEPATLGLFATGIAAVTIRRFVKRSPTSIGGERSTAAGRPRMSGR